MPPAPRPIQPRQRAPHSSRPQDHPPSSLDLLFSYSRSAQFYGDNISSAPSFVERSRLHGRPDLDATTTDEESAIATGDGTTTDEREGDTTTDDLEDEGEGWSEEEDGAAILQAPWHSDGEHLPPNAISRPAASPRRREGSQTPQPGAAADEQTPLLGVPPSSSVPSRPSSAPPVASTGQRRPSTFSKENWKAKIEEHRGESSWGQTLFNTINVLVGVGLLADPLAMADSGWAFGIGLLLFCSFTTFFTALLLARLMKLHPSSHTYADVLIRAYGPWTRSLIYFLFVLELSTFSVAAVELFADSLASLYPKVGVAAFKFIAFGILLPTTFLPLRLLSLTSLLGIFSSVVLLAVLISDGAIKPSAPGSLRDVMPTSWTPRWGRFPLSFGLFMSGFSGHAVVPSLYRDMKNPRLFGSMAAVAFTAAFVVSIIFAVLGYLMFGNGVSSEITRDLASTPGYPVVLNKIALWMVGLNPLFKFSIANKPLVQTFEHLIGLHTPPTPPQTTSSPTHPPIEESAIASSTTFSHRTQHSPSPPRPSPSSILLAQTHAIKVRRIRYFLLRPGLTALCVGLAILIPEFDRVLAFLGSASAFVICVILPVGAYLISGRKGEKARRAKEQEEREALAGEGYGSRSSTPKAAGAANGVVARARQVHAAEVARRQREREGAGGDEEDAGLTLSRGEKALCWFVLLVSVVLATVGTVWSFLPVKEAGLKAVG
ncbi:hypothetical protein JCM8547_006489 [Rhodosporidiobolus lusitaniae]